MKITEKQLIKIEDELDKMGWVREDCGYWIDPFTLTHNPTTKAYEIAMQRRKKTHRIRLNVRNK